MAINAQRLNLCDIAVQTAEVASTLKMVQQTAYGMTLVSINAKILTAQAGHRAAGFGPITDYISETARDSMGLVEAINQESLKVSRSSVEAMRTFMASNSFEKARQKAKGAAFASSIIPYQKVIEDRLDKQSACFAEQLSLLRRMLDDIRQRMQAAQAVVSLCRVEATSAGEYRKSLEVVADDLAEAVEFIKKNITESDISLKHSAESL